MKHAFEFKRAGAWNEAEAIDRVVLDAGDRHRRRVLLNGENGTKVLLNLRHAAALRDGDALVLEDGTMVRVCARPESLVEISAKSANDLARLAWHIGNRHTDMQVIDGKLRIRRDHVLEEMLVGLGAELTPLDAPFDPESGAYEQAGDGRHHDHHHGQHRDRHDRGHAAGQSHGS